MPSPPSSPLPGGLGRRGPTRRPPLSHQTQCSTCFPITWQARQRCSKFIFHPERGKQRQGRAAAALGQLGKLCSQPGGTEPAGRARRQGALSDPPPASARAPPPASRSPRLCGSSRLPRPQTPAGNAPCLSPTVSLPLCLALFLTAPFPLHSTSLPSPHAAPLPYPPLPHLSPTAPAPSLCLFSLHPTCLLPNPFSHLDLSPLSFPLSQLPSPLLIISSP